MNDLKSQQAEKLTFGQMAVGLTFNPSGDDKVNIAKQKCADLIDMLEELQVETTTPYLTNTIKGQATRSIMDAQMWIVKYITWKY